MIIQVDVWIYIDNWIYTLKPKLPGPYQSTRFFTKPPGSIYQSTWVFTKPPGFEKTPKHPVFHTKSPGPPKHPVQILFINLESKPPGFITKAPGYTRKHPVWDTKAPGYYYQSTRFYTKAPGFIPQSTRFDYQTTRLNYQTTRLNNQTTRFYKKSRKKGLGLGIKVRD